MKIIVWQGKRKSITAADGGGLSAWNYRDAANQLMKNDHVIMRSQQDMQKVMVLLHL